VNEDLSLDARKWFRGVNSEDESCHCGKLHLPFANSAIKKGAPQARQVSDRWHLTKNLAACVSVQLAQSLAEIRRAEQTTVTAEEEGILPREERRLPKTRAVEQAQRARQAERMARYEQIIALRKRGMRSADIAAQVGMAERTIRHWLTRENIPHSRPRRERARLIDP